MDHVQIYSCPPASDGRHERYGLSDIDRLFPSIMVPLMLVYQLDYDAELCEQITTSLRHSLSCISPDFPTLFGRAQREPSTQRISIVRTGTSADAIPFVVKKAFQSQNGIPSYAHLVAGHFHPSMLDHERLLPLHLLSASVALDDSGDNPMTIVQVTFIQGGMILACAFNHMVADGVSHDLFLQRWSQCAFQGSMQTSTKIRSRQSTPLLFANDDQYLSASELRELEHKLYGTLRDAMTPFEAPTNEQLQKNVVTRILRFREWKLTQLRKAAGEDKASSHARLSTHDVMTALLWRAVTRSRIAMADMKRTRQDEANLYLAVNLRQRNNMNIPADYFGNAVCMTCVGPAPASGIIADNGLANVAQSIRMAVEKVNDALVADVLKWSAAVKSNKNDPFRSASTYLTMDMFMTSWGRHACFETDFGFGRPSGFRTPETKAEVIIVYPARPTLDDDGGYEVCLGLEESCMLRLINDAELLQYADVLSVSVKSSTDMDGGWSPFNISSRFMNVQK